MSVRIRSGGGVGAYRVLLWLLVMAIFPAVDLSAAEPDDVIVIRQEDIDRLRRERGEIERPRGASETPAEEPEPEPASFAPLYTYPFRECFYWHWLDTGALDIVGDVEERIDLRSEDVRRARQGREWSESLQRELDELDEDIGRLETERETTLSERLVELEMLVNPTEAQRTEAAIVYCALALLDLDTGKAKEALKSIDLAARFLRDEPFIDLLRGIAHREAGNNAEARLALVKALSSQPRMLPALIALAQVHEDALDYDEAAEQWKRAGEAPLGFPRSVERWANRNPQRYPEGENSLRRVWTDYFKRRLRLARLRDFAYRYYESREKPDFKLIYDPSIGVPPDLDAVGALRNMVKHYLEFGEGSVPRGDVESVFAELDRERDRAAFNELTNFVGDSLTTARREMGRRIGHMPRDPATVVLHNPAIWETLVESPSTLGVYRPPGRSIHLYVSSDTRPEELKDALYHEYGHYVTLDLAGPRRLPLWLCEGLAEAMALESGHDRYVEDPYLARWSSVWRHDEITRAWFEKGRESFDLADYYKARRCIGVLEARFGWSRITDMLAELGGGADLDQASKSAFGMEYRALQDFLIKQLPAWTGP